MNSPTHLTVSTWRHQLPSWKLIAWIAVIYLYCFPYFPRIQSANELPRVYLTQAIVDEGKFSIDTGVATHGTTADVSRSEGHHYANKPPGASLVAIPGYLVAKTIARGDLSLGAAVWVCRITTGVLPTIGMLLLFGVALRRWGISEYVTHLTLAVYALGSMAMTYSLLFLAHQLAAVLLFASFFLAWFFTNRVSIPKDMARCFVLGLCAGLAVMTEYQSAIGCVVIAGVFVDKRMSHAPKQWRRSIAMGLVAVLGFTITTSFLLYYHKVCFGSMWQTGYDASQTFAHYHQEGFLGLDKFRPQTTAKILFGPATGLFIFSPIALFGLFGLWKARQTDKPLAAVCTLVVGFYLCFLSSLNFWRGGWTVGPRYIVASLPFLFIGVAFAGEHLRKQVTCHAAKSPATSSNTLMKHPLSAAVMLLISSVFGFSFPGFAGVCILVAGFTGSVFVLRKYAPWFWLRGLAMASMAIYLLTSFTFPHFPEAFSNPFWEITMPLLFAGNIAPNVGSYIGLPGIASVTPLVAGVCIFVGLQLGKQYRAELRPLVRHAVTHCVTGFGVFACVVWFFALLLQAPTTSPPADAAFEFVVSSVMPSNR